MSDVLKYFVPSERQQFYKVDFDYLGGFSYGAFSHSDVFDSDDFKHGNCFESESDVKTALEYLKVAAELRRLSAESGEPDNPWDGDANHYFIVFDFSENRLAIDWVWNQCLPGIYFPTREAAKEAAEKIGAERLIKYWLGIPHVLEKKEGKANE